MQTPQSYEQTIQDLSHSSKFIDWYVSGTLSTFQAKFSSLLYTFVLNSVTGCEYTSVASLDALEALCPQAGACEPKPEAVWPVMNYTLIHDNKNPELFIVDIRWELNQGGEHT